MAAIVWTIAGAAFRNGAFPDVALARQTPLPRPPCTQPRGQSRCAMTRRSLTC